MYGNPIRAQCRGRQRVMAVAIPRKISRKIDGIEVTGWYVLEGDSLMVTSAFGSRSVPLGQYCLAIAKALLC